MASKSFLDKISKAIHSRQIPSYFNQTPDVPEPLSRRAPKRAALERVLRRNKGVRSRLSQRILGKHKEPSSPQSRLAVTAERFSKYGFIAGRRRSEGNHSSHSKPRSNKHSQNSKRKNSQIRNRAGSSRSSLRNKMRSRSGASFRSKAASSFKGSNKYSRSRSRKLVKPNRKRGKIEHHLDEAKENINTQNQSEKEEDEDYKELQLSEIDESKGIMERIQNLMKRQDNIGRHIARAQCKWLDCHSGWLEAHSSLNMDRILQIADDCGRRNSANVQDFFQNLMGDKMEVDVGLMRRLVQIVFGSEEILEKFFRRNFKKGNLKKSEKRNRNSSLKRTGGLSKRGISSEFAKGVLRSRSRGTKRSNTSRNRNNTKNRSNFSKSLKRNGNKSQNSPNPQQDAGKPESQQKTQEKEPHIDDIEFCRKVVYIVGKLTSPNLTSREKIVKSIFLVDNPANMTQIRNQIERFLSKETNDPIANIDQVRSFEAKSKSNSNSKSKSTKRPLCLIC